MIRGSTSRAAGSTTTPSAARSAPAPVAPDTTARPASQSIAETATSGASTTAPPAADGETTPPAAPASDLALVLSRLPFKDGERLDYQVKYGFLGVGSAVLEVLGLDSIRGTPTVHASFRVKGGVKVYSVNDSYESWFDPHNFITLRTVQNIDEGSYERQREYDMYPHRRVLSEKGKPDTVTVPEPLDEASFLFFVRTIPLEVGKTYQFNRYFKPDKNPVSVIVERKERVKVPAGTFETVVVRPIIKTSGIFGEGGRAEVWFTDDSTRTLVQLKSKLKFGSLNLYLRNRRIGTPWLTKASGS